MTKVSRKIALLLAFILVFTAFYTSPIEAAGAKVTKVVATNSLTGKKTVVVAKGKKIKLTTKVTASPNTAKNRAVTYKSSNPKVAKVSAKGVIKGVKAGKATITVTSKINKKIKATVKVTVKASAVTGIKIKNVPKALYVGKTLKLKAVVSGAKTAYKALKWTTSNKKVVTVSATGVIKGIKPGTAKITAKALDGSGKKVVATIKVTKEPIEIKSVKVVNPQTVTFTLAKATKLTIKDLRVDSKMIASGAYRRRLTIDNVFTKDNKNYTIILSDNTRAYLRCLVQVSIPTKSGKNKKEAVFNEPAAKYIDEEIIELTQNEPVDTGFRYEFDFDDSEGYYSQTLKNLPSGVKYRIKDNRVRLYGTPTKVGVTVATYSAIDEVGNTITKNIVFIVGSKDAIRAAAKTHYGVAAEYDQYAYIDAFGGSGSYDYEIVGTNYNLKSSGSSIYGVLDIPGTYTVKVNVKDRYNEKLNTTVNVKFVIKQGVTLAGVVTDQVGNKISDAYVRFINKNKGDQYTPAAGKSADENGAFSVTLNPGTYDIEASFSGGSSDNASATRYLYSQKITETKSGYDIKLPLYKVKFAIPQTISSDSYYFTWKDAYGDSYGSGESIYVKKGSYKLTADISVPWYEGTYTKLASEFTVSNSAIFKSANLSGGSKVSIAGNITSGTAVAGSCKAEPYYKVYRFKANTDSRIYFQDNYYDKGTNRVYVDVYDNTSKSMVDSGMYGSDSFYPTAGHEYYVRVRAYYTDEKENFTYNFTLTQDNGSFN